MSKKMYYEQLGYDFDPPFYAPTSKPIVTNYDRIISKTPEELAEFLYNVWKEQDTFSKEVCERCGDTDIGCQPNCWLDSLKTEVQE